MWQDYYKLGAEIGQERHLGWRYWMRISTSSIQQSIILILVRKMRRVSLLGAGVSAIPLRSTGEKTRLILIGENEVTESWEGLGNEELVQQNG